MNPGHCGVDKKRCQDLDTARRLEWLVTNGRGGFAMASTCQMLTRRYHGLLVAAVDPPVERYVLLAKLDAAVAVDGRTWELATNDYRETICPQGYQLLESFTTRPHPTWRWRAGPALIEQTLCIVPGEDTTFVRYRLIEGPAEVGLTVRPLCTSRHFHLLARSQDMGRPTVHASADGLAFQWADDRPRWHLSHNGRFTPRPDWYYGFFLSVEARRGYDFSQDLFVPGTVAAALRRDDPAGLVFAASTRRRSMEGWREAFDEACSRDVVSECVPKPLWHRRPGGVDTGETPVPQNSWDALSVDGPAGEDPLARALFRATDDFLVARKDGLRTVIAGYPWFGDWGRDTFISLTGLCLVPGRTAEARQIIETFAKYVEDGLIPNRFPDFGEPPAYNTVDAALWYIHAVDRYLTYSGDWAFVADGLFAVIADILSAHEHGTRYSIHRCDDGLLAAGEPGLALTWMDAKVGDRAITPRIGKPVEINALWYNALRIAAAFAKRLGDAERARRWGESANRARASFNKHFWNQSTGCLFDVVDAGHRPGAMDGSIRPNQLLAISLTHPVLDAARWRQVVAVCQRDLWTPVGMRTLAPADPAYRGHYGGDLVRRDEAYHQGTVWPWLLGPFVSAYVKAFCAASPKAPGPGRAERATHAAAKRKRFLEGLTPHLGKAGIGSISEVADGDIPHTPGGCPWQAWSVAEPLRALCEDVLLTHPPGSNSEPR